MKPKPYVGQRLFGLNVGNSARHAAQVLKPVVVKKVGRKCFTVATDDQYGFETEFHIEDWCQKTQYTPDVALYQTEQEWNDEKESRLLLQKIRDAVKYGIGDRIPLDNLRKIAALLT